MVRTRRMRHALRKTDRDGRPNGAGPAPGRWTRASTLGKFLIGTAVVALIGALASPVYLPRLLDAVYPERPPVEVQVSQRPPTPSVPASPGKGSATRPAVSATEGDTVGQWAFPRVLDTSDRQQFDRCEASYDCVRDTAVREGGFALGFIPIRMTLTGLDRTVSISGVRAEIISRARPFDGSLVTYPLGGMGQVVPVELDLDQAAPRATLFDTNIVTIAPGEVVGVNIDVHTRKFAIEWRLVVDFVVGSRTVSVVQESTPALSLRISACPRGDCSELESQFTSNWAPS
jgi:hypothetical protein